MKAGNGGIAPGHAYRAYRYPHRKGGRLSRRVNHMRVGKVAGALTAFLIAMGLAGGVAAAALVGYFAADLPTAHDLTSAPVPLSTYIYDRAGEHLLYTLEDERRELITLDAVPLRMRQATIAIEDKTFYSNPGIDVSGIVRAFTSNLRSGGISQGASTITQQLIKTRLLGDEPTLAR